MQLIERLVYNAQEGAAVLLVGVQAFVANVRGAALQVELGLAGIIPVFGTDGHEVLFGDSHQDGQNIDHAWLIAILQLITLKVFFSLFGVCVGEDDAGIEDEELYQVFERARTLQTFIMIILGIFSFRRISLPMTFKMAGIWSVLNFSTWSGRGVISCSFDLSYASICFY